MAEFRSIFPSFQYEDIWYMNQIRNAPNIIGAKTIGFRDGAEFEKVRRTDEASIKKWIHEQFENCSCLVLFWGATTYNSKWVKYEWDLAAEQKMARIIIHLHGMKDQYGNPYLYNKELSEKNKLSVLNLVNTDDINKNTVMNYYWTNYSNPYEEIGNWIEEACQRAGR